MNFRIDPDKTKQKSQEPALQTGTFNYINVVFTKCLDPYRSMVPTKYKHLLTGDPDNGDQLRGKTFEGIILNTVKRNMCILATSGKYADRVIIVAKD